MDSGYDAKLEIVESLHRKDLQRLENLTEKNEIKEFIEEIKKRAQALEEDVATKEQTISEAQSFLSMQVAKDDKEIVQKKLEYARNLLELADRKINPEYYAAKERTSSFVPAKTEPAKRGSLREPILSRTRTSSVGEASLKGVRSSSLGTTTAQPTTPTTSFVKLSGETSSGASIPSGSTSIDKDMEEIDRLFRQSAGQGYKKENAEEISKYLTNLATTLFMQIREPDVINPKRHKAKDSTDLRYSQFSNKLFEIVSDPFKRLDDELKKIDAGSKSPEEKQKLMQEKEMLIRMLMKISEDLREKRNFIALMSTSAVLDAQLNKKANAEIKEKLSDNDLDKIKANSKLYEPGSNELTTLQEKYLREKKSVIPQIGSMKNKFVYIDEYKNNEKTKESAIKQETEQVALFRFYQQNLAREMKQNLFDIKLKYSEIELKEIEAQAKELHQLIENAPTFEDRHKLYEQLMSNLEKRSSLLNEQKNIMKSKMNADPLLSKRTKDVPMQDIHKISDIEARKNKLSEELINSKNAMLFNEAKVIASMDTGKLIEIYSDIFKKQLKDLSSMLVKLSDDTIGLPKKADLIKEADLIMHDLDTRANIINHRAKELTLIGEKALPLIGTLKEIAIKKEDLSNAKMAIEANLGRKESISLHTTIKPVK